MVSSSISSLLLTLSFTSSTLGYKLVHNFDSTNWFQSFDWHTEKDPSNGFVDYISLPTAQSLGLAKITNNQVFLGVDNTNVIPQGSRGRKAIWLTSKIEFTRGLLIGDFAHIPSSDCGSWPAFWTTNNGESRTVDVPDPEKVLYGEIDILEYFSDDTNGAMTLHTDTRSHCTFDQKKGPFQTGERAEDFTDCTVGAGCSTTGLADSVGTPFNAQGGGVYAMDWTEKHINIYSWPRNAVPKDITDGQPDVANWGTPVASFDESRGDCDMVENFVAQTIYFDTTFCGDMAGGQGWTDWSTCAATTGVATCEEYVRNNPRAFANAYWLINSVKVYQ